MNGEFCGICGRFSLGRCTGLRCLTAGKTSFTDAQRVAIAKYESKIPEMREEMARADRSDRESWVNCIEQDAIMRMYERELAEAFGVTF